MYRLNYIGNFATCIERKIVHNTIFLFTQTQLEIFLLLITDDGILWPKHVVRLKKLINKPVRVF
jgi:hypothetical protein